MKGEPKPMMIRLGMLKRCMISWMNSTTLAMLYLMSVFVLTPFSELVNGRKIVLETTLGFLEGLIQLT
jgi:hypothetical protein